MLYLSSPQVTFNVESFQTLIYSHYTATTLECITDRSLLLVTYFYFSNSEMKSLPVELGNLKKVTKLMLTNLQIQQFPIKLDGKSLASSDKEFCDEIKWTKIYTGRGSFLDGC